MPSYSYKCSCGNEKIIVCKMSEYSSTIPCDKCNEQMTRKVKDLVCGLSVDKTNSFYRKTN